MSVSKACEICGTGSVRNACDQCGALVCDRHFEEDLGLCMECAAQFEQFEEEYGPGSADPPDGVDTYRF